MLPDLTRAEVEAWSITNSMESYPHVLTEDDRLRILQLINTVDDYKEAIRQHRDERGDDRCWIDDKKLYNRTIGAGQVNTALPPFEEMMNNCKRFFSSRQDPEHVYVTVAEQIDPLKREIVVLKDRLKNLKEEMKKKFLYDLEQTLRPTDAGLPEVWEWRKKIREILNKAKK